MGSVFGMGFLLHFTHNIRKLENICIMSVCSHQDETRKKVGVTALGVAALRALETEKATDHIISDPYARELAGSEGFLWIEELRVTKGDKHEAIAATMVDGLAIRTRKIDEIFVNAVKNLKYTQIVVPAAGLDSRPWRLNQYFNDEKESLLSGCNWFELDFPEMFEHKFRCINNVQNAGSNENMSLEEMKNSVCESVCCGSYCCIEADLSLSSWPELLETTPVKKSLHAQSIESAAGTPAYFNKTLPSVWLLEGFTSYLTTEELTTFFEHMSKITCKDSLLVVTFISKADTMVKVSTHRSSYADPKAFVTQFGYECVECLPLNEIVDTEEQNGNLNYLKRKAPLPSIWDGYFIIVAKKV